MEPHVQGQSTSPLVREGGLCGSHASAPVREGSWVRRSCLTKQGRQRWAQMLLMPWICSDFLIYMNVLCFGRGKEEERGKWVSHMGPPWRLWTDAKRPSTLSFFVPHTKHKTWLTPSPQPNMEMRSSPPRKLGRHGSMPPHPKTNATLLIECQWYVLWTHWCFRPFPLLNEHQCYVIWTQW
jgi:hypothetical protein